MHGQEGKSHVERATLVILHTAAVALSAWVLLGDGLATVAGWVGAGWEHGGATARCWLLLGCAVIYYLRVSLGAYLLIKRRMGWAEVGTVAPFLVVVHAVFAFFGAQATAPIGPLDYVAVFLYLLGSFFNTGSEVIRHFWKKHPENKGKIYTGGLFALSMHINYFGDSVLFTGYAMLTLSWWTGIIPVLMTLMFIFMHIPMLDKYLEERYGDDFRAYAKKTKKLIPCIY
jgi:protein-S-isoprenylcysteine O-methyltransferase Ste14